MNPNTSENRTTLRAPFLGVAGSIVLGLGFVVGCGGSTAHKTPTMAATSPAVESPATVEVSVPATPTAEVAEVGPQLPPAPATPPGIRAGADLVTVDGTASSKVGTVSFEQIGNKVSVTGTFTGLSPGLHGFYVHELGDCGGKRATNAGRHFNPGKLRHGGIGATVRHVGDFGNLSVDAEGRATFEMSTDSLTVSPGPDSVVGRAIVIHARKDDGKTQPSGNAGSAVACGVIGT